jgi:hypothetical protein
MPNLLTLKRTFQRIYAGIVNDKRPCAEYSWRWLNRYAESLFWTNGGAEIRPQYAWGAVFAAAQARALGHKQVALLELGVAGGTGLVALETIAMEVATKTGVRLAVYGFDTGRGLPAVTDPHDLPHLYAGGDYIMDVEKLKVRLRPETQLVLGDVAETIAAFLDQPHPPVGFISFDLDLYTSTRDAMQILRGPIPLAHCLPRVVCYMDDIMALTQADINGERLAIREYNEAHYPCRAISPVYGLRYHLGWPHSRTQWPDMMFWASFLDHPDHGVCDRLADGAQAPLRA